MELFSSPLGQKLYGHISFDLLATVTVQVEGEEEKLFIGAMMYVELWCVARQDDVVMFLENYLHDIAVH